MPGKKLLTGEVITPKTSKTTVAILPTIR
jgi:hypothetical protein